METKERELQELLKRAKKTDLHSYLALGHHQLFLALPVRNPSSQKYESELTVTDKLFPLRLRPWSQFPSLHEQCQHQLEAKLGDDKRFYSPFEIETLKDFLWDEPYTGDDVSQYHFNGIEGSAKKVVDTYISLHERPGDEGAASLPRGVKFVKKPYGLLPVDHTNVRSEYDLPPCGPIQKATKKAVQDAAEAGGLPPAKRAVFCLCPKLDPDHWCFRVDETPDGCSQVPLLVIEHTEAHKLRAESIKSALENTSDGGLFWDVLRDGKSKHLGQDERERECDVVIDKRMTAHAIVLAFDYMIESRLQYCYVTSSEALLLLHMDPSEPRTLFYHLTVPREEVAVTEEGQGSVRNTAVALVSTMILLALEAVPLTQRWQQQAQKKLAKWPTPYEEMISTNSRDADADADARERHGDAFHAAANTYTEKDANGDKQVAVGEAQAMLLDVRPTTESICNEQRKKLPETPKAYCSQACLLGLRDNGPLDPRCPNFRQHQFRFKDDDEMCDSHFYSSHSFANMLRLQLDDDPDDGCECLDKYGKFGESGVLFRLVSQRHGYCLVAKGVNELDLPELWNEKRVYHHLRAQQGVLLPVCLGIVRLAHEYWTSSGAKLSHMLLLSYCGELLRKPGLVLPADIGRQQDRLWEAIQELGIDYGDERLPKSLWNAELQRVMCINLDSAKIVPVLDEKE